MSELAMELDTRMAALDNGRYNYRIVRFYKDAQIRRRIIRDRLSLEQAQQHCSDPQTSSSTCTSAIGNRRTRQLGAWFDGYESY